MLKRIAASAGALPDVMTMVAGYWSEENDKTCTDQGIDAYNRSAEAKEVAEKASETWAFALFVAVISTASIRLTAIKGLVRCSVFDANLVEGTSN